MTAALIITAEDLRALEAAGGDNLFRVGKAWRGRDVRPVADKTVKRLVRLGLVSAALIHAGFQERCLATGDGLTILAIARRNVPDTSQRARAA